MSFEIDGLKEFIGALEYAEKNMKDDFTLWLEAIGMEFLGIIQNEIIATETVDTRRLLNSFDKGNREGVWQISDGGMTLEVGTNLEYAGYANDGHWTTRPGVERRWVPGYWQGDKFTYMPGADTGMLLQAKWVPGSHYWDMAFRITERMFEASLEKLLQEWLDTNFT